MNTDKPDIGIIYGKGSFNLHRKDIPLSELARATEMKMDALKRKQGRRSKADILSGKEPIKRSDELVGEDL